MAAPNRVTAVSPVRQGGAPHEQGGYRAVHRPVEIQCGFITKLSWGIDRLASATGGKCAPQAELVRLFLMEKGVSTCKMRLGSDQPDLRNSLTDKALLHTLGRDSNG